jgi:hypothetical protein
MCVDPAILNYTKMWHTQYLSSTVQDYSQIGSDDEELLAYCTQNGKVTCSTHAASLWISQAWIGTEEIKLPGLFHVIQY